jgi:hypothetical protein
MTLIRRENPLRGAPTTKGFLDKCVRGKGKVHLPGKKKS